MFCCWIQSMPLKATSSKWNDSTTTIRREKLLKSFIYFIIWNILSLLLILIVLKIKRRTFSIHFFLCFLHSHISQNNINFLFFPFASLGFSFIFLYGNELKSRLLWTSDCAKITEGLSSSSSSFCLLFFVLAASFFFIWFKLSSSVRLKNYCSK